MNYEEHKSALETEGFSILENLYSDNEVRKMVSCIDSAVQNGESFQKSKDLFAIRQLLIHVPELAHWLFTNKLKELIYSLFSSECFLTKAIYFDKPSGSNWFVSYHQDLSIAVNQKADLENYCNWTYKKGQYGVQPPMAILQDTVTVRIHLDDTDRENGALKVIPGSHLMGIVRPGSEDWQLENACTCEIKRGGAMLMKPLTMHTSNRTANGRQRRVIHLEFNQHGLTEPLTWLEQYWF